MYLLSKIKVYNNDHKTGGENPGNSIRVLLSRLSTRKAVRARSSMPLGSGGPGRRSGDVLGRGV